MFIKIIEMSLPQEQITFNKQMLSQNMFAKPFKSFHNILL